MDPSIRNSSYPLPLLALSLVPQDFIQLTPLVSTSTSWSPPLLVPNHLAFFCGPWVTILRTNTSEYSHNLMGALVGLSHVARITTTICGLDFNRGGGSLGHGHWS